MLNIHLWHHFTDMFRAAIRETSWKKFRSWLKRHSGPVIFLSTLVVLGSLIARDITKEKQKDLADAIENAENIYSIHEDFNLVYDELNEIKGRLDNLNKDLALSVSARESLARETRIARSRLANLSAKINAFESLSERLRDTKSASKLPNMKDWEDKFEDLNGRRLAIEAEIASTDFRFPPSTGPGSLNSDNLQRLEKEYRDEEREIGPVLVGGLQLEVAVDQAKETVLDLAEVEKKKAQRNLTRATFLSFFLCAGSVLLGVLGQAAGIEGTGLRE